MISKISDITKWQGLDSNPGPITALLAFSVMVDGRDRLQHIHTAAQVGQMSWLLSEIYLPQM